MINWPQFIDEHIYTDECRIKLICDYEQLRDTGSLGDCLLRTFAEEWITQIGVASTAQVMRDIAHECYINFAHRWIKENGK